MRNLLKLGLFVCHVFFLLSVVAVKEVGKKSFLSNEVKSEQNSRQKNIKNYSYEKNLKKKFHLPLEKEEKENDKKKIIFDRINVESEYEKCMNLVKKQFEDTKDKEENVQLKTQLENLCLEKKKEDEQEEAIKEVKQKEKEEKEEKEEEKENEIKTDTIMERKKKEIKSQLGLSSNMDIPLHILEDALSELKNCTRNYREECPLNWKIDKDKNNRTICIAPESYIGSCEKEMYSDIMDITEKKKKEKKCQFFWKCDKNCIQDMDNFVCPLYWEQIDNNNDNNQNVMNNNNDNNQNVMNNNNDNNQNVMNNNNNNNNNQNVMNNNNNQNIMNNNNNQNIMNNNNNTNICKAPSNYTGKCLKQINFSLMDKKEKVIYSNICDIVWPCKEKCEKDYSVLCPEGWIEKEKKYCIATNLYKGKCEKILNFQNFDKKMKELYEEKCNFNYPCRNNTICEKNYDDLCPNLWIKINENECAPSEYYFGECKENYIFKKKKNIEEKKQFEKLCNVSYSCLQTCKRDYSSNCPIGWKETLTFCLAPNTYKYSCKKTMNKNLKENEKIEISKKCNVFWPCSNYEVVLKNLLYDNMSDQDYMSIMNGPVDFLTGNIVST